VLYEITVLVGCPTFSLNKHRHWKIRTPANATFTEIDNLEPSCLLLCLDRENCRLFAYYELEKTCRLYDFLTWDTATTIKQNDSFIMERKCHEVAGLYLVTI